MTMVTSGSESEVSLSILFYTVLGFVFLLSSSGG
jgi:hypothetical protein